MKSSQKWKEYKAAVLERVGDFSSIFSGLRKAKESSGGWVSACCPLHDDKNPSFAFNRKTGRFACFSGCGKGGPIDFIMLTSGSSFKEALFDLGDSVGVPRPPTEKPSRPPIREDLVKKWAKALWANEEVLRFLREKRGISDETLKRFEIGWDAKRQRNTIPVRDERGNIVNVRLYNGKKRPKMINYTEGRQKYGSPPRLFGLPRFKASSSKQVIISEGEWDCMLLDQEGFTAVTGTHGADTFRLEWAAEFTGRDVVILYDCDKEGQNAVRKTILPALRNSGAASVRNVVLPLKGTKDDKDVSDYLHERGLTAADLQRLIDETKPHSYAAAESVEDEKAIKLSSFTEIESKDLIDKKIKCDITVCGETSEAFHAVERFRLVHCPRLEKGTCMECADKTESVTIPKSAQEYIGSCMTTNVQLIAMLRDFICPYGVKPALEILQRTTVKEFFCHQRVNRITQTRDKDGDIVQLIDGKKQELVEKRVYYLSSSHPKPGSYEATGWVKSHPKTQQITFLIDELSPQEDDYESFVLEENVNNLRAYQALSWEEKLEDLTENVTRVYERDEILLAVLLTYCSPRWIPFNGEIIRGWLVTVILGDSGTGKTQTYQRIAEFIDVGDCFSGLTGSRTGLAYAMVEHKQKGWQVRIGRYPANSRKILTVDETQYLPEWDLRTISKAMEEGFLQIDRVSSKGYESQTRLIMIANPKRDAVMDSFAFGCEALKTIFPPTIIRRTDIGVFANSGDIKDLSFINRRKGKAQGRKITPDMLRALVYWAWNLTPERIQFTKGAEQRCLDHAKKLSETYGHATDVPLINLSDSRKKVARIAVASAVVDASADRDFNRLLVSPEHADMAESFLRKLYSNDNCALDDHSNITRQSSQLVDYDEIAKAFAKKQEDEKHGSDVEEGLGPFTRLLFALRTNHNIRREDLIEQAGLSGDSAKRSIRFLKRFNLVDSGRDGYAKKPKFNKFLRRFMRERPEFFERVAEQIDPDAGSNGAGDDGLF